MDRRQKSRGIRTQAAETAFNRAHPEHLSNGDEQLHGQRKHYPMSFTKGLEHDETTGLVKTPAHFEAFRRAINGGEVADFNDAAVNGKNRPKKRRKWEAPTAGFVFDLEGPDAQAVTMNPAPKLGNGKGDFEELAFEMAEVYELALLRDVPFSDFVPGNTGSVKSSCGRLNKLPYGGVRTRPGAPTDGGTANFNPGNIFRGIGSGVTDGPYISQFLLIGNKAFEKDIDDGFIQYGGQTIDQRVPEADKKDYMTKWDRVPRGGIGNPGDYWLEVQNGVDVNGGDLMKGQDYVLDGGKPKRRFISTPRDLATYVHFDALYQAYLNAALILLSMKAPFDPAFAPLHGQDNDNTNVEGFALYGGPHILTLVTEVATRALKAVRYQKFNNHLRLRPEALAARIGRANVLDIKFGGNLFEFFRNAVNGGPAGTGGTVDAISGNDKLLPMAFREGSPMHPSYGAGHATVAGACVTVLKAFFDTSTVLGKKTSTVLGKKVSEVKFWLAGEQGVKPVYYQVTPSGSGLTQQPLIKPLKPLTLEGELNKLAANISIGRNMAGVHYYSDYYDSLLMGEEIAIGILEEQSLCYTKDPFAMSLRKFDGTGIRINIKGD